VKQSKNSLLNNTIKKKIDVFSLFAKKHKKKQILITNYLRKAAAKIG
jgi:hypothetical protein